MKTIFLGFLLSLSGSLPVGQKIILTSLQYGMDPVLMTELARCESGFQPYIKGDNGKAFSYYQFHRPTFDLFKEEAGAPWLRYENPDDSIELAVWAIKNGKKDHWTCFDKVINDLS